MSAPTDEELRSAAHRSYGRRCSLLHCAARGDDRGIYLPSDLQATREDEFSGTWITAMIWIPDSEAKP